MWLIHQRLFRQSEIYFLWFHSNWTSECVHSTYENNTSTQKLYLRYQMITSMTTCIVMCATLAGSTQTQIRSSDMLQQISHWVLEHQHLHHAGQCHSTRRHPDSRWMNMWVGFQDLNIRLKTRASWVTFTFPEGQVEEVCRCKKAKTWQTASAKNVERNACLLTWSTYALLYPRKARLLFSWWPWHHMKIYNIKTAQADALIGFVKNQMWCRRRQESCLPRRAASKCYPCMQSRCRVWFPCQASWPQLHKLEPFHLQTSLDYLVPATTGQRYWQY